MEPPVLVATANTIILSKHVYAMFVEIKITTTQLIKNEGVLSSEVLRSMKLQQIGHIVR